MVMATNYLNGKWVDEKDMMISALDLSVIRGFGIFDYLRTYGKVPFRLKDHIDRFFNSAKLVNIKPIKTADEIEQIILEGIKKNGFENTQIKFVQTGGVSPDGFTPGNNPSFFVTFAPANVIKPEMYKKGIKLVTTNLMRQIPYAKTLSYIAGIVEVQKAAKLGAQDILYVDSSGDIYEATRSNFFSIKGKELITAEKDILSGITRKVVLEIAEKVGLKIVLRFLNKTELKDIDEAFITNSSQEILPVSKIDNVIIGYGKCGQKSLQLMTEFKEQTL